MITPSLIHDSFIGFFLVTIFTKITLLLMNISNIKKHSDIVPERFQDFIKIDDHLKAQKYTMAKNEFAIFGIILHAIILLVWLEGGLLNNLNELVQPLSDSSLTLGVIYIVSFTIINSILGIPEALYSTFVIEEKFGFNKMTPALFVKDLFKNFVLSLLLGGALLYGVLFLLNTLGSNWWLYTWIFIIAFQFIMIWAYPKFIAPLFNKFSELDDETLTGKINELSERTKIVFKDYFVMNASIRSSHGNAYFTGFGKNKRIVFFDTLLKTLEPDEVISVLAHELGHLKKKHIVKSIIISAIGLFIGLFALGQVYNHPALFEAFNLQTNESYMALLIFTLIVPYYTYLITPVFSWMSRKNEFEADEFAATYASSKKLISALLKMYKDNSSTLTPHPVYSKFYYSHPPANERVDFLSKFDS